MVISCIKIDPMQQTVCPGPQSDGRGRVPGDGTNSRYSGTCQRDSGRWHVASFQNVASGTFVDVDGSQLHEYGMQCFTARNDMGRGCTYHGDSVNELSEMFLQGISQDTETRIAAPCWDDLVCINVAKVYSGAVVNPV